MCGIAGYVQRRQDRKIIEKMTARLAHRGPDGQGIWEQSTSEWSVALGHRRLSIIDLGGGHQPLSNEDGTVWVTYNGEIYNFAGLRANLQRRNHRFETRCDTEVIVHQYEEYGEEGLRSLDGMFAFGIWDQNSHRLLLARDRVGIKPLYYAELADGGIVFASELTSVLEHPEVGRSLDPDGLASLLFLDYVHPPRTLISGVRKLEPGHFLIWTKQGLQAPRPFWTLSETRSRSGGMRATDLAEELKSTLSNAVESQLVSDVPVGVFLSGGLDSSVVAALAQKHSRSPIQTFSISFEDRRYDESAHARRVAAWIGSVHVEKTFSEMALLEMLDAALDALDEPMADPSILPTFLLSSVAAQHVKVVLGGDGGDELWAGYPTYKAHRCAALFAMLPQYVREEVIMPWLAALPVRHDYQSMEWKIRRFFNRWDNDRIRRHLRWMSSTDMNDLRIALPRFNSMPPVYNQLRSIRCNGDFINQLLAIDFTTYLPGSVLTKVDRASMAHGLEVRPPLLANRLVEFAFSLPSRLKLRGLQSKALLKTAAASLLPADIISRRKKGFGIPLAKWINGPLRPRIQSLLNQSPIWETGLLRQEIFAKWLFEHQNMQADRSKPLWTALVLDRWCRQNKV